MWRTKKATQILALFDYIYDSVVDKVGKQDSELSVEMVAYLECCFQEHLADDWAQRGIGEIWTQLRRVKGGS